MHAHVSRCGTMHYKILYHPEIIQKAAEIGMYNTTGNIIEMS